ncbi:SDR family oxidoreductase [Streptococcus rifensis]
MSKNQRLERENQKDWVMVTGGATGIGFSLAKKFHQAGYGVILVGRRESKLKEAVATLPNAIIEVADISKVEDRQRLISKYSYISVLVNNAGIQINQPLIEQDLSQIEQELEINLIAPILLTRLFLPYLVQKKKASIVNVTSGLAIVPKESASVYCACKAGLHSFSKTLRWQLANTNVNVHELVPPLVSTDMTSGRGKSKIDPDELVIEFWKNFQKHRETTLGGKTKLLVFLNRFIPSLAEGIMRKGA